MSDSNPSFDDDVSHCNSNHGSGSDAIASDLPVNVKRRHRKTPQTSGKAWAFQGTITTNMLSAYSDSVANMPGLDDQDDEQDDDKAKFLRLQSRLKAKLGDNFESFLGAEAVPIRFFVIYCDLSMILQMVPDHDRDPVNPLKVQIQIRGFLQTENVPLTKLQKCVPPVSDFLSGTWERCIGGLKKNWLYQDTSRDSCSWMALHNTGKFGDVSNSRITKPRKSRRLNVQVIFGFEFT